MRACVLTGIRSMACRDVPDPRIKVPTDVLLRIATVGVCGSDVHYYTQGRIGTQVVHYPFAVGHECSAIVEAVGSDVSRVSPGDRVAVDPAASCGTCDQCRAGRPHTCRDMTFLGCPGQVEGCLSEYLVMPEDCCFPVADSLSLEEAALLEPFTIGVYTAELGGRMGPDTRAAILGCGPIGLSTLLACRAKDVQVIYATDRIDHRLDVARHHGAVWAGNPDTGNVIEAVAEQEPLGLDVVFECCGQQAAVDQAVALLKPGGRLVLTGIPEVDRISFNIDQMRRKELVLQNVRRQNGCVEHALELMESGKVSAGFMITHRFPLERAGDAFDLVAAYGDNVVKAVINVAD